MTNADFAAKWDGPPMVVATDTALGASALTPACRKFLGTVGLPSNALWFDSSSRAIMCFDSIACLRELCQADVSPRVWSAVGPILPLTILGIHGSLFVVADGRGRVLMVQSDTHSRVPADPDWSATVLVNHDVGRFASCLLAYKEVKELIRREEHDFRRPAVRNAVARFRAFLTSVDEGVMADETSYWFQVVDHLDVW